MHNITPSEMDPERWQKIEALYNSALSLDPNERGSWLAQACAGDESIQLDVLSLLESADTADSFLEEPALSFGLTVLGLERESLVGGSIGRYKIIETLGHGGMGEVYLAQDSRLARRVALKLLPASIIDDRERVRRFEQEARAASAISHPNVAHIYEIGEAEGRNYITMEYIKGPTLRHLLRKEELDPDKAIEIAIQVATALSAAHRAGVIHRDIKPENIIMAVDGYVKVLDFGLAKLIESSNSTADFDSQLTTSLHTGPDLFMGTSHYMSPEQVRRQALDLRTDLWSLAVVIYEMLTFRRPFQGQSFSEVIVAIIEKEPELASWDHTKLPDAVRAFLVRALQKRPEDRYQTADEMLGDLRQLQQDERQADSAPLSDGSPHKSAAGHPPKSARVDREPTPTAADPIRPQTLAQRFDTVSANSVARHSVFTLARDSLTSRWVQLAMAMLLVTGVGAYYKLFRKHPTTLAGSAINLRFERLNLSGSISDITLSPDGKYVSYVVKEEGKDTIHITELATISDLRVAPPSSEGYSGLSFSPDGTYVYYLETHAETGTLYRVSKLGGGQRKILDKVNTPVTFSPDGTQMAFVRSNNSTDPADLIVAKADGASARVLVKRTRAETDFFLSDPHGAGPAWSPDGTLLACPTLSLAPNTELKTNLEIIEVQGGSRRVLNTKPWSDISRVLWLADGSGLVVATQETADAPWQLQSVAYPGGEVRKLTNDPNNYTMASSTRDSSLFLTLNSEEDASIWRLSVLEAAQPETMAVARAKGISEVEWGSNGRLLYTISDGAHLNIWEQDAKSPPKRMTFEADNSKSAQSPDGRYIVFVSTRAGTMNIWRMNSDGTQPMQLTRGSYEDVPSLTPNSRWVIYRTGSAIKKVSIDGGESIKLFDKSALCPAVSPDGRLLAIFANDKPDSQVWHIEIYDLSTLALAKRLELPKATTPFNNLRLTPDNRIRWTPDGRGLSYTSHADGASNIWLQPLGGGAPSQLTHFRDAEISSFAWSPDAKQITCVRNIKAYAPVLVRLF